MIASRMHSQFPMDDDDDDDDIIYHIGHREHKIVKLVIHVICELERLLCKFVHVRTFVMEKAMEKAKTGEN